nr:hypothetical protein [uncultured Hyphomonas sp.]
MKGWLSQFEGADRDLAVELVENLLYVSTDEFQQRTLQMLRALPNTHTGPFGLYVERKVRRYKGIPNRLFDEQKGKVKRSIGGGPKPVDSTHAGRHEVGSEGILAQIATQVQRGDPATFFNHPGPNAIRRNKIRRFVLITDFVGTGNQSSEYLDAAWRNASTKSWASGQFLKFIVICHSATPEGRAKILSHTCQPEIIEYQAAPTLSTLAPYRRTAMAIMCDRYGPTYSEAKGIPSLGYGNCGALIAFAHGVPNNAPRLLFKRGRKWEPLFPGRVTSAIQPLRRQEKADSIARRLLRLSESRIAHLAQAQGLPAGSDETLLVLAALKRRPRTAETVSSRTELPIAQVKAALMRARAAGWIDADNRLTKQAYTELEVLREKQALAPSRFRGKSGYYVPQSLRAPMDQFS